MACWWYYALQKQGNKKDKEQNQVLYDNRSSIVCSVLASHAHCKYYELTIVQFGWHEGPVIWCFLLLLETAFQYVYLHLLSLSKAVTQKYEPCLCNLIKLPNQET